MKLRPAVSVLVPVYNPTHALLRAVRSALTQTAGNLEVIVIDDGSRRHAEDCLACIDDPRLNVIRHDTNRGVASARNTGLKYARAPLIALLDADDLWAERHLSASVAVLERDEAVLVYGNARLVHHPYSKPHMYSADELSRHPVRTIDRLAKHNPIVTSTVVARADAVRAAGGWPTWLRIGEDWWLYLMLVSLGYRFALQDQSYVTYEWPSSPSHASAHAYRYMVDGVKLANAARQRWPSADLPVLRMFGEPLARYLLSWLPWWLRNRLRACWLALCAVRRGWWPAVRA